MTSRLPRRFWGLGLVLLVDLVILLAAIFLFSDQLTERETELAVLSAQRANAQTRLSEAQAALAAAEPVRIAVAAVVSGGEMPDRLRLLRGLDEQRQSHGIASLHYHLGPETAEPVVGTGLEQVAHPLALDQKAASLAGMSAFWQDVMDHLPGKAKLDSAVLEKGPADWSGHMEFRALTLRRAGEARDVP